MQPEPDTKEPLKDLWQKEITVRKEAQQWGTLSNAGFVGLVATEIPEFIGKEKGGKPAWRLPLFVASSVSIVTGVVMNWFKGNKAEELRESALMMEHAHSGEKAAAGQWSAKIAAEQNNAPPVISK